MSWGLNKSFSRLNLLNRIGTWYWLSTKANPANVFCKEMWPKSQRFGVVVYVLDVSI